MGIEWYRIIPRGDNMSKQVHVRMDDTLFNALSEYTNSTGQTVQSCISDAILQMLGKQKIDRSFHNASFTFIDLFAGIGGMRIAFENAGGRCGYSNEWNKYCQQTYFANFGDQPDGDITKVNAASIPDHDILVAGFP
jgi:DNA (cytosine-5)-methyltransferase 1